MRRLAFFLSLLIAQAPLRASAEEPAASDSVSAQAFFQRGRDASARGDHEGACRAFEESLRLEVAVGTLFNLAHCEEKLGRLANASQHLQEGLDRLDANDPRREPAKVSAAALDARVPRLTVRLRAGTSGRVFRDGVELSTVSLGAPLPVNPGAHLVVVRAAGHAETKTEVTLNERELRTVEVAPGANDPSASPSTSTASLRTPMWIAAGTSAAALGVGLVTGGLALDRSSVVDEHCKNQVCDPDGRSALSDGQLYGNVSTVAFITAGVAAGVAIVLWIVDRKPATTTAANTPAIRF